MEQNKAAEIAQPFFDANPAKQEAWVTSDEQVFFNENLANNHARSLRKDAGDKQVAVKVSRELLAIGNEGSGMSNEVGGDENTSVLDEGTAQKLQEHETKATGEAVKEQAAKEQAAKEQPPKEQAAKEQPAKEQVTTSQKK